MERIGTASQLALTSAFSVVPSFPGFVIVFLTLLLAVGWTNDLNWSTGLVAIQIELKIVSSAFDLVFGEGSPIVGIPPEEFRVFADWSVVDSSKSKADFAYAEV